MLQLQSGILSLRHENIELRNDIAALKLIIEIGFATVNGNVRSVAIQPARQQVTTASGMDLLAGAAATGTTVGNEGTTMLAPALAMMNAPSLMPNPKSLFDLWDEYLNGVGAKARKALL
jgi:stage V sporulation protein SpoVS